MDFYYYVYHKISLHNAMNMEEKAMATHSRALAWKIPWTEEGGLQSMASQRVGHD